MSRFALPHQLVGLLVYILFLPAHTSIRLACNDQMAITALEIITQPGKKHIRRAYYTVALSNSATRQTNAEKKHPKKRDLPEGH